MTNKNWLPLNEYSAKHKISMSTLRRRIRAGEVEHRFDAGKYWIVDEPISKHARLKEEAAIAEVSSNSEIVSELKKAYVSILHEKEEQILQLKEELVDLKTLVKILESENERLRQVGRPAQNTELTHNDFWINENLER